MEKIFTCMNYLNISSFFQKTEVVQFEMDESRLAHVLQNMKDIEDQIVQYCQQ